MGDAVYCCNPDAARHEIHEGDRRIDFAVKVNWGAEDIRDDWQDTYSFCSFKCVREWADKRSADHDNSTLKEGI